MGYKYVTSKRKFTLTCPKHTEFSYYPSFLTIDVINTMTQNSPRRKTVSFYILRPALKRTQAAAQEAGNEAETVQTRCLLACSPCLLSLLCYI